MSSNEQGNAINVEVKVEPEIPSDTDVGAEEMGDVEISETDRKRKYLISSNQMLRKAILELRERQEILLEFFEVELGAEVLTKHRINRERMMYVLGYTEEDIAGGRQNEKYVKLMRLMNLAHAHWRRSKSQMHRPSNREARLRYESNVPRELAELRVHVDFDSGFIGRKPIKRCHKCYDESHEMKECPYKHAESRTPQVNAIIAERYEKLRAEEGSDPTLSKAYKKYHYKIDEKQEKRKAVREQIKDAKRQKL